ncbi:MAG: iron chelate uptake ABC transporter family permease subunit [Chloroflexi bacterium]|nr:iron chelate uptake ABC transporter family permease subunit [Chloroflexota bacterium]
MYGIAGLILLLGLTVAFATSVGSVRIPVGEVWRTVFSFFAGLRANLPEPLATIILDIRLPRILLTALVGAALAVAGATYQGLFRNPLADPYLIGVSQGAGLGATIGFLLPLPVTFPILGIVPVLAFAGAFLSAGSVYFLARRGRTVSLTTLILAGVAIGAFLAAVTSYLLLTAGEKLPGIIFWLMGGFSLSHWREFLLVLPYVLVGSAVIFLYSQPLNVLQLGDEQAQQLGVNVERVKLILLLAATLVTAAAVSFVGTIGFVGIIVPHGARLIWGPDHRFLIPLSALAGASFLILADTFARSVLGPVEVPVGVVTAFCGAPFFLYLLRSRKWVAL